MRSTSIFLLFTSVLTFSFTAFSASAEDGTMHQHNMSAMAEMPGMNKPENTAALYSASGVIKAWRRCSGDCPFSGSRAELAGDDDELCARWTSR